MKELKKELKKEKESSNYWSFTQKKKKKKNLYKIYLALSWCRAGNLRKTQDAAKHNNAVHDLLMIIFDVFSNCFCLPLWSRQMVCARFGLISPLYILMKVDLWKLTSDVTLQQLTTLITTNQATQMFLSLTFFLNSNQRIIILKLLFIWSLYRKYQFRLCEGHTYIDGTVNLILKFPFVQLLWRVDIFQQHEIKVSVTMQCTVIQTAPDWVCFIALG